jgi:hypothetical protein
VVIEALFEFKLIILVNIVLVLGSERLHSDMLRRFSGYRTTTGDTITLVKLDKSGGCVDRDDEFMQQSRDGSIKEYFFGDIKRTLSPHTQQINFDDATIYRIREGMFNRQAQLASTLMHSSKCCALFLTSWWSRGRRSRAL